MKAGEQRQAIERLRESQRTMDRARHVLAQHPAAAAFAERLQKASDLTTSVINDLCDPTIVATFSPAVKQPTAE